MGNTLISMTVSEKELELIIEALNSYRDEQSRAIYQEEVPALKSRLQRERKLNDKLTYLFSGIIKQNIFERRSQ